jgi:pimeloyl-ACP methyl ester carboxylesterase
MTRVELQRRDGTLVGEDVGTGPALLLLHAGGESRAVWAPVAKRLADHGFRSVAYDLRGHGESGTAGADRLATLSGDVAAMLSTFEVPPLLAGASIGGLAAVHALADPAVEERCAGLALVDVVPAPPPDMVREYVTPRGLAGHPLVAEVLSRAEALQATAAALRLPLHLVRGCKSPMRDAVVTELAGQVPALHVHTIAEAGHLVARDAPGPLADVLAAAANAGDVRRRRIESLLRAGGADRIDHPGDTLADHLDRTGAMLEDWGAEPWVVDAGRVHAAYGTDGFPHALAGATPEKVVAAVGARSERLIDLYCHCDRAESYPTFLGAAPAVVDRRDGTRHVLDRLQLRAFAELTVANELDVLTHAPDLEERHGPALAKLFASWRPLVGQHARAAVDRWIAARQAVSPARRAASGPSPRR